MLQKTLLWWGFALVLISAGAVVYPEMGGTSPSAFLLSASSSLLGIVSYFVQASERSKGAKLAFMNFSLFFLWSGVSLPTYQLAKRALFMSDVWSDLYYYQYHWILFFLIFSFCVVYLVVDLIVGNHSTHAKYFATLAVVAAVWINVFYPFLSDSNYLYGTADVRNFVAVRERIDILSKNGKVNPTAEEIAASAQLMVWKGIDQKDGVVGIGTEEYVAELQRYIPGDNYRMLFFRPLFASCAKMSLLSVFCILFYIAYQYTNDSPQGAYLEKIVWCLLPLCAFETLHTFAFTRVTTTEAYSNIAEIGQYLSLFILWMLLLLFGLRLRFVQTVEGKYYERRLLSDPSRVTRWRDSVDNWVLKQFMNSRELDRRFLAQRKEHD
jgi:hypothetical protein